MSDRRYLHVDVHDDLTVERAADLVASDGALGVLYLPAEALFVTFQDGLWTAAEGRTIAWTEVFEAVFFTPDRQVRWVHRDKGAGDTAELSEAGEGDGTAPFRESIGDDEARFLWGRAVAADSTARWAALDDARTGRIRVPTGGNEVKGGDRARLHQVTYLTEDDHGNRSVADVRYTRVSFTSEKG
ncbi:MAG: CRISPR-associated protein Csx19 [Gordonia sp. (in: high G+C Gram-positive bacteria)]|uniref:type III-D CRISPR-associated protein Csx19 n=1 Tax=Gordonia sp. (in: high G+C Gram-positive bacteria) TaxID=84139 RepID=UPI0039E2FCAB